MGLLSEIQNAAVDSSVSTADFLRRCQILAARLRHEPFKTWVMHELNGYPDDAELPPYRRGFQGEVLAQTSGPFGSGANNVPVSLGFLGDDLAVRVRSFDFYQGVGGLEGLIADAGRAGETLVATQFEPETFARLEVLQGHATVRMWKQLPVTIVRGIVDAVKSRALAFTLEIEAESPQAGDVAGMTPPVSLPRADAIFTTTIYGGNVAVGPGATVQVVQGDLGSLMAYLEAHGVEEAERRELADAIKEDGRKPGNRVAAWIGKVSLRLAASGGRVLEGGGGALLAAAIARYFGLG